LLQEAAERGPASGYAARLQAAFEARRPAAAKRDGRPPGSLPPAAVDELFSERELEVLRLVAQGQTNQEIGQALFISVNTVKTHLEHIYGKLGVSARRQAAARARQLGLLA
jgi:LuxR family maltose regulon positive regulatory protein